jgi:hypothetical protein
MSEPRDFRLERLKDRNGLRSVHLGEVVHFASPVAGSSSAWTSQAAHEALIDAVFTAPGALEWLSGLRRTVAAWFAEKDSTAHIPAVRETTFTTGRRLQRP